MVKKEGVLKRIYFQRKYKNKQPAFKVFFFIATTKFLPKTAAQNFAAWLHFLFLENATFFLFILKNLFDFGLLYKVFSFGI